MGAPRGKKLTTARRKHVTVYKKYNLNFFYNFIRIQNRKILINPILKKMKNLEYYFYTKMWTYYYEMHPALLQKTLKIFLNYFWKKFINIKKSGNRTINLYKYKKIQSKIKIKRPKNINRFLKKNKLF